MTRANDENRATILIVDDFEDNRQMYAEFLTFSGFRVIEAADGAEAVAQATRAIPDVVIMDLSLPVIDGWEATRRLKADPRTRDIPVLTLTGHALDADSIKGRDVGGAGFLPKPCLPEDLLEAIERILAERPSLTATLGPT